jgi:hypothetical protein
MASARDREDPLVKSARREALLIFIIWCVTVTYCVGYSAIHGYGDKELTFTLGFPSWVFWGVVVPWGICTLLALAFTWFVITDDPLGAETENPEEPEHVDAA